MNVRALLHAEYRRQKAIPFDWPGANCAFTAADFVKPIIGRDVAAPFRGRCDSEIAAKRMMIENGWADMGDYAASLFAEIPVAQAVSGDWVQITNEDGTDGLGVVCGAQAIVRAKEALTLVSLGRAKRAFRVA